MNSITNQTIISLTITVILLLVLPIAVFLFWKIRCRKQVKISAAFIGAAGFLVSVRVLELIPHIFCIILSNPVSRFINGHVWAYVLYGITMAGVFEECGRYIVLKFLWKKEKTTNDVIMYGIGHGGVEVWAVSLPAIVTYLVIAVMIQTMGLDAVMSSMKVTADQADVFQKTVVDVVTSFGGMSAFLSIYERIIAMALHVSLTCVVYYGIRENKKIYLLIAVLAHAVFDIFPALYQKSVVSMSVSEIWITLCLVVTVWWTLRLYRTPKKAMD